LIKRFAKSLLVMFLVLWIVATLTFLMLRMLPGGPFDAEKNLPPEIVANIKAKYHMDKPLAEQYGFYMKRLMLGDLGISYKYVDRSVNDILASAFPVSFCLGMIALAIAVSVGVTLGTVAALNRGTWVDSLCILVSTFGVSVPGFVVGALLIFIFGLSLKILPVALWESGWHMVLPAITLAFGPAAYLSRLTRASVLEVLDKDWVRTARSKGMPYRQTVLRHVVRNALVPVATVLGPLTAIVITGSFVVEYIYAIPGMGRFFVTAVSNRDYDLVIGTTLVFAALLVVANGLVDLLYQVLDPRITLDGEKIA
jgi:oligopeptide transport system permease protein